MVALTKGRSAYIEVIISYSRGRTSSL